MNNTIHYTSYYIQWGVLTQKKPKKPVATPKSANWHWFFFGFFWFFKISKLALVFFGFFWFFWHWFWPEFEIGNWFFLVFLGFFGFFCFFLVFFGLSFGQHSKLETGFWVFLVFFLGFFGFFLAFDFKVGMSSQKKPKKPKKTKKNQKNPKKNKKKPVATPKLVNWLGFFWFFLG